MRFHLQNSLNAFFLPVSAAATGPISPCIGSGSGGTGKAICGVAPGMVASPPMKKEIIKAKNILMLLLSSGWRVLRDGRNSPEKSILTYLYHEYLYSRSRIEPFDARAFFGNRRTVAVTIHDTVAYLTSGVPGFRITLQTLLEMTTLAACVTHRAPRNIVEFGTANGGTCYLFYRNAPAESRIVTVDSVPREPLDDAMSEMFSNQRVVKLCVNTREFSFEKHSPRPDFIFIDAGHSYEEVKGDTEAALSALVPGGMLIWHDYKPDLPGVYRYLTELSRKIPLRHVRHTSLVVYVRDE